MSDPIVVEKFAVGQSVRRVEDPRLVQGLGRYSDDVNLARQAWAVLVRSPHAHARIRGIDARAALAAPGMLAVLTAEDLAADGIGNLPTDRNRKRRDGSAAFPTPRPALARGRARHVGDPVALVIAETHEAAVDAAEQVAVDYEPLPAVAAAMDALRPGAPAVWDEAPDNVAFLAQAGQREAVDQAFARAAHVTRVDFVVTRVAAAPLEPRAAVGEYDRRSGRYTLHTGIQGPHGTRTLLASALKVPQSHMRVITGEVGGSFGMRSGIYPEMILVLWAARRLGRPVKWTSDRREGFVTDEHGRDNVSTAELALDRDGTFLALRVAINLNVGAYLTQRSAGPGTNNIGGVAGVYTTPAIHHQTTGVFTNTTPTGPYRGAGRPEATFAIERVIDVAAHELRHGSVALRRKNLIPPSAMPFKTGLVFTYDCGDFARSMDLALSVAEHASFEKRRAEARTRRKLRGLGIANAIEVAGGPYTSVNPDTAQICVNPDGSVTVNTGSTSMGQGNETAYAQIVCDHARRGARARPGPVGRQRRARERTRQRRLGRAHRGRLGDAARHREDRRARPPHRGARDGGRARGHRVPRRPLPGDRHRSGPGPGRGGPRRLPAQAGAGHGVRLHRDGGVHAAGGDVPQRLPDLRGRDRRGHRRAADRPPHGGRRRRQDGQSAAGEGPDPRRGGARARAGALREPRLRRHDGPAAGRLVHGLRHAPRRRRALLRGRFARGRHPGRIRWAPRVWARPVPSARCPRWSTRSTTRWPRSACAISTCR